jgi:site-specific DNA recombinase
MPALSDRRHAAVYAWVSTDDQGKGFSIPTQIEACQKLAGREGYTVPESHILVDEGVSGTTMDRPALRQLRELVNARAIAAAIVYDPDRLSRNLGHQLLLAEEFERAAVKLLIVSHPLEQGINPIRVFDIAKTLLHSMEWLLIFYLKKRYYKA